MEDYSEMIWARTKDVAIMAGLEPLLRPLIAKVRKASFDEDHVAALELISALPPDATCVDIGCHKGLLLDPMRQAAPRGHFFAFEPIPYLYKLLKVKYRRDKRVELFNCALSSSNGHAKFLVNEREMGLSRLRGLGDEPQRRGDHIRAIDVLVRTLDGAVGDRHVDFIKIDVEGAELSVLEGARSTILRSRPLILFEFGLGGSDQFGVVPADMFDLFSGLGYSLHTVPGFVQGHAALTLAQFSEIFAMNSKWNFIASAR